MPLTNVEQTLEPIAPRKVAAIDEAMDAAAGAGKQAKKLAESWNKLQQAEATKGRKQKKTKLNVIR